MDLSWRSEATDAFYQCSHIYTFRNDVVPGNRKNSIQTKRTKLENVCKDRDTMCNMRKQLEMSQDSTKRIYLCGLAQNRQSFPNLDWSEWHPWNKYTAQETTISEHLWNTNKQNPTDDRPCIYLLSHIHSKGHIQAGSIWGRASQALGLKGQKEPGPSSTSWQV